MNVYKHFESATPDKMRDPYLTTYWMKPKEFKTLDDLADEIARVREEEEKGTALDMQTRFDFLNTELIYAKYRYYKLDDPELSDSEYDKMEKEYEMLAKELGVPPVAVDMVGYNEKYNSLVKKRLKQ